MSYTIWKLWLLKRGFRGIWKKEWTHSCHRTSISTLIILIQYYNMYVVNDWLNSSRNGKILTWIISDHVLVHFVQPCEMSLREHHRECALLIQQTTKIKKKGSKGRAREELGKWNQYLENKSDSSSLVHPPLIELKECQPPRVHYYSLSGWVKYKQNVIVHGVT